LFLGLKAKGKDEENDGHDQEECCFSSLFHLSLLSITDLPGRQEAEAGDRCHVFWGELFPCVGKAVGELTSAAVILARLMKEYIFSLRIFLKVILKEFRDITFLNQN
jgi:hypothetical protein